MFKLYDIFKTQGENESVTETTISDGTEMSKRMNDTKAE